ncbi:MAG: hypothetical protein HYY26_05330 [Acidobacteria bacterium]|nr:hypothetical protein [Acidobacteriota bacterium]
MRPVALCLLAALVWPPWLGVGKRTERPQTSAAAGVLLVPRFAPGERVRYRMTLEVETTSNLQPLTPEAVSAAPLRLAFDITWQLEALEVEPDGAVRLRAVIEGMQFEASPGAHEVGVTRDFVGQAVSYRLRAEGQVDSIEAPEEWLEDGQPPAWLRAWLEGGSGSGLPLKRVEPGESWRSEREFEVAGLPRQRLVAESTYLRDEHVGATPCASILTRFELSGSEKREEKAADGAPIAYESRVEGGGSRLSCYDLRNGRLLESTQSSRESVRLEIRRTGERASEVPPLVLDSQTTTESHVRRVD